MPELQDLSTLTAFCVPGLVIIWVRSQFVAGRMPPPVLAGLNYVATTLTYYGLAFPFSTAAFSLAPMDWFLWVIIVPALFGVLLGLNAQKSWFRRLVGRIGVVPVHPAPTAWDWWFGQNKSSWVIVTLKDGTKFGGFYGGNSFASSDPLTRDLLIEQVYSVPRRGKWKLLTDSSLYVPPDEIRSLEFVPLKGER